MAGTLTHSPADILRYLLIESAQGTNPNEGGDWPIFVSTEPDSPDSCITIYDTEHVHQGRVHYGGEVQERHGVQIRVRSDGHRPGYLKICALTIHCDQSIYLAASTVPESIDSASNIYRIHSLTRTSGPITLGKQAPLSKRYLFTVNYTLCVRQE